MNHWENILLEEIRGEFQWQVANFTWWLNGWEAETLHRLGKLILGCEAKGPKTEKGSKIQNVFSFLAEFSHLFPMKLPLHCSISFETSAKIYPQRSLCRVTISTTVTVGPKWKAKVLLNSSCWEYKCSPCTPT